MKATRSALLKWLARSLVKCIPMGEAVSDFATDVLPIAANEAYEWWHGDKTAEERRADLETLATADPAETKEDAAAAVQEAAKELDCEPSPELMNAVQRYLEQVPDAIRRSMRRPEDTQGRTVPPHLMPRNAHELAALLPQRPPQFKPGDRPIPGVDIELVSPLGAGGFGEVWRARKTHLGQDVALKFCLDPNASQSLRNETALLRRLMNGDAMHPDIVRLQATYNDCTALEYEFVEGGDLAGVIRDWHADGKRPKPRDVIEAVRRIAEIVAFAHALSPPLVHRDLKPANILVNRKRDGTLRFRLTDFGIGGVAKDAKHLATGKTIQSSTTSIHGSYSALYASPQQMRAEPPAPTDDVFSLGVIFWQLANGDLGDGVPGGTAWAEELEAEGYPAAVVSLMASCFDRRADHRPQNAGALVEGLRQAYAPPPMPKKEPAPPTPSIEPQKARPVDPPPANPMDPTMRVRFGQAEEKQRLKRSLAEGLAQSPRDDARLAAIATRLESLGTIDAETGRMIQAARSAPPVPPPPGTSKKKVLIILGSVVALLLVSCVVLGIIGALVQSKEFKEGYNEGLNGKPSDDDEPAPPGGIAGDQYVNTVQTARGPANVVRNGGDYFLTQPNGPRQRIHYDEATGAWTNAN